MRDGNRILKEKVKESYERIAQIFEESRTKPWVNILKLVIGSVSEEGRIVDLGCGSGANARYLYNTFRERYVGVDISFNMVRNLKNAFRNIDVICGDLRMIPLRDGSAEASVCIATLHHIPGRDSRASAIYEIYRILRPGSEALITVWRIESKDSLARYVELSHSDILLPWKWKLEESVERFYHLYSKNEILEEIHYSKVLHKNNMKIITSVTLKIGRYLNDVVIIFRPR